MRLKFKEHLELPDKESLSESLVGKGFAIGQQRRHQASKTKLLSVIS